MQPETVTLANTGLAICGTLGGVVVGNYFQARGQHQQWRRDNVRQECRELLGQLSVNLFAVIDWRKSIARRDVGPQSAAYENQYGAALLDLHRNFGSRILIADELKKANIPNRWKSALESFDADGDLKKLNAEYEKLREDIVQIGLRV